MRAIAQNSNWCGRMLALLLVMAGLVLAMTSPVFAGGDKKGPPTKSVESKPRPTSSGPPTTSPPQEHPPVKKQVCRWVNLPSRVQVNESTTISIGAMFLAPACGPTIYVPGMVLKTPRSESRSDGADYVCTTE
jgi:hypothetical protein